MPLDRLRWTATAPESYRAGAVTIGNFDGVHRGHAALVRAAGSLGRPAVAVTFDPPPARLLYPGRAGLPLTTLDRRAELLRAAGADQVAVLEADAGLLSLSPEAFFEDVIVRVFGAAAVAEGYNFRFGRARVGDTALLNAMCVQSGLAFTVVGPELVGGEPVSSSRVRAALEVGEVAQAAELLGRPHAVEGIVETGARRGRTIGFPTANLGQISTLLPLEGVYAGRVVLDGDSYAAAANLGPAPTFGVGERKLEAHLLDFSGDLYARTVRFEFVARLRGIRAFAGIEDLVRQLQSDVAAARTILTQSG